MAEEAGAWKLWKKHVWQADEDELLRSLVTSALSEGGKVRWSLVGAGMDGRSGKQCRERWHNHLSPDVSKNDWTPQVISGPRSPPPLSGGTGRWPHVASNRVLDAPDTLV